MSSNNAVDTDDDAAVSGRQSLDGGLAAQSVDVQCWGPAFLRGKVVNNPLSRPVRMHKIRVLPPINIRDSGASAAGGVADAGKARQIAEVLCQAVRTHSRANKELSAGQAATALRLAAAAMQAMDAGHLQVGHDPVPHNTCARSPGLDVPFGKSIVCAAWQHAYLEDATA